MAIQKASDFRRALFEAVTAQYGDTEKKALDLIRADRKAVIEEAIEEFKDLDYVLNDGNCEASHLLNIRTVFNTLDSLLRELD
jgi:hypothetical protein